MTAAILGTRAARWSDKPRGVVACLLATVLFAVAAPASADQRIEGGATVFVDAGVVDLSCTDLVVAGTLNLNQGTYVNVRDVIIQTGGVFHGGTGALTYSGKLVTSPGSTYAPQSAIVHRNPVCLGVYYGGEEEPIPTLGDSALVALAVLMLLLASLFLGEGGYKDIGAKRKGQGK